MNHISVENAKILLVKWQEKLKNDPNLKCSHNHKAKEYYLGSHTGDFICTTCGQSFNKI